MPGCKSCPSDNMSTSTPQFRRVLWVALLANFSMFIVEIVASHFGDSLALQADALDFFADSANYTISLVVVGMTLSARAKASLFKGASMGLFGLWVVGHILFPSSVQCSL